MIVSLRACSRHFNALWCHANLSGFGFRGPAERYGNLKVLIVMGPDPSSFMLLCTLLGPEGVLRVSYGCWALSTVVKFGIREQGFESLGHRVEAFIHSPSATTLG